MEHLILKPTIDNTNSRINFLVLNRIERNTKSCALVQNAENLRRRLFLTVTFAIVAKRVRAKIAPLISAMLAISALWNLKQRVRALVEGLPSALQGRGSRRSAPTGRFGAATLTVGSLDVDVHSGLQIAQAVHFRCLCLILGSPHLSATSCHQS